jgi:acetyl-CoA carboxylase biotin carboxylase subunit
VTRGTVLVANRGEIAVRVIRAARKAGWRTAQVHSRADRDMLAVRLADQAVEIGPAAAAKSYLNIEAVLRAARETGAAAIHPGYGFLAENAAFAEAVEQAGLIFIGPTPETIRTMGDKAAARAAAIRAGVPVVPGSDGVVEAADAGAAAARIGFPVMIKAAAGGGGRGIRVARTAEELAALWPQASAEARAAFGDGRLYLERFVGRARHVEVQILGDGHSAVHLFERECSVQRRRQKVWEEAPAAALPEASRRALCAAAVRLAEACRYRGAGTVEYLYDDDSGEFFFIEMNTRIQVEHPVSEMITGIDLVAEMIRIAAGERLRVRQDEIVARGHAIEVRINAEDAARGFAPSPGLVTGLTVPGGFGVRFDGSLYAGYTVPPFYDSLLGKLIVWDSTRAGALAALRGGLDELRVEGIATTIALHAALARDPAMAAGRVHTRWLESWLETADLGAAAREREMT